MKKGGKERKEEKAGDRNEVSSLLWWGHSRLIIIFNALLSDMLEYLNPFEESFGSKC